MREESSGPLLPLIWRSMPDLGPSFDRFAAGLKARAEAASYARRPTPAPSRDEIRLVSTLRWKVVCESGAVFAVAEAVQEAVKIVRRQRRQPSVENLVVVHLRRWLGGAKHRLVHCPIVRIRLMPLIPIVSAFFAPDAVMCVTFGVSS